MKKEFLKFSAAALLALMLVPQVQAASVSVTMTQTNVDEFLPDGLDYLSVTISDGLDGAIDFSVEILSLLTDLNAGSDFGIQEFTLNLGNSAASVADFLVPSGWFAREFVPAGTFNGFGDFDIHLKGTDSTRQQPLEFSIVDVVGDTVFDYVSSLSTGSAAEGNVLFAARLAG
ncbi:MAG: hypothetical protein HKN56_04710, partial [Gammaproteobacteria bacterium]|nr:hypothetical protein [Gammaproteobacteria bacterium]